MDNRNELLLDLVQEVRQDVKALDSHLSGIDKTLALQHEQLATHIMRTNLLQEEMKKVNRHIGMVEGGIKVIGSVSIVLGILELISRIFSSK